MASTARQVVAIFFYMFFFITSAMINMDYRMTS